MSCHELTRTWNAAMQQDRGTVVGVFTSARMLLMLPLPSYYVQVKGGPRDVVFVSQNKESHVIEVPDSIKVCAKQVLVRC
jgi:hypothetical protein